MSFSQQESRSKFHYTEMYMYLNLYIVLQEGKLSPEKGESPKKHIPTIKAPSLSSANQIRIVPSVPRAMRKRSGAQEVTPEVFTSPVQQPKTDRFKIIPPKPKSSARTEKSRPEVKPPEVEEPEMETGSEETVVTIEVNLDSVDENEAEDSDSLEENDQKVFITARKRSLRRLCLYTCLSVILFIGGGACLSACWDTPPGADTPSTGPIPLRSACWEIRATSGRYPSYWNAYLLVILLQQNCHRFIHIR